MAEEDLMELLSKKDKYNWTLYFFKKDKRNKDQPFVSTKIRYKDTSTFYEYVDKLLTSICNYQLSNIEKFEDYNGMNPKISCDKLNIDSPLIREEWTKFVDSIGTASSDKLRGRIMGYVICGEPIEAGYSPITILKCSSPIITLNNKYTITYKESPEEELDIVTDSFYRLFWIADSIIYNNVLYAFNNNFETMFDLEKAIQKVKERAIESILNTNAIENIEQFKEFSNSYKSPKCFITLNDERLKRIEDYNQREELAKSYNLPLSSNGKFLTTDDREYKSLIHFLCLKSICEDQTKIIYETSSATKIEKTIN